MVALLSLDDISIALKRAPTSPEESAEWQQQIDAVSAFINGYVSVSFTVLTNDVVRYQADYYGMVELGGDPVSTVSSVKNVRSAQETQWYWDGLDQIFYLSPFEVVDVTYTHGYTSVPEDIKYMALQAVLGALNLGATGDLTSFTVGDVTEVYASSNGETKATVISLSEDVLKRYSSLNRTYRLGIGRMPDAPVIPTL